MNTNTNFQKHYVAVIGGSIAGSEAASILAQNEFKVVVFDMNVLPYGKIEDGLPNWHINLRNRQIAEIDKKLNHPNIRFVPKTKIGSDINFLDLVLHWGFSAIILANGAWQDRQLSIVGIEKYKDVQLIYQNAFIYWFNHKHEADYSGKRYTIASNTVVIGGGLSSLDVIKVVMIELVKEYLFKQKNIEIDLFALEKYGIDKTLNQYGLNFSDLNIQKAKLIYRRTARDMPLKSPKDQTPESIEAAKNVSEKLLNKYLEKYNFEFIDMSIPVDFVEKNGKLTGIILQKVTITDGKVHPRKGVYTEVQTDLIISSIGSLPEQINGLKYENSTLKMRKEADYHVAGFDCVFAVGNAVTGRGNILESKKHGKQITNLLIDKHLTEDVFEEWLIKRNREITKDVDDKLDAIVDEISHLEIQPEDIIQNILDRTRTIHKNIGYQNYMDWVSKHLPIRLEEIQKK